MVVVSSGTLCTSTNTAEALKHAPSHCRVRLAIEMIRIGKPANVVLMMTGFPSGKVLKRELLDAGRPDLAAQVPFDAQPWTPTARDVRDTTDDIPYGMLKRPFHDKMPGRGPLI